MRRAWWRAIVMAAAVAAAVWPVPAAVAERWFGGIWYPGLQRALTSISNLLPLALFDVLLCAGVAAMVWGCVSVWRAPRGTRWHLARRRSVQALTLGAAAYLVFLAAWGLNYQRPPVTARIDFDDSRVTREAVRALNETARAELVRARAELPQKLDTWPSRPAVADMLVPGLNRTTAALGLPGAIVPGRPKFTMLDPYFTRAGVSGMTDPFFLETLVASNMLPFETPMVIAHEWGHLAGLARESDASFFGWLVCLRGPATARYSAWYETFLLTLPAFGRDERRARLESLPAPVRADIRAASDRTQRDEVRPLRLVAWRTYDTYLKVNRVDSGVQNYGEVVRLMTGARFDAAWRPVRRE